MAFRNDRNTVFLGTRETKAASNAFDAREAGSAHMYAHS